MLEVILTIKLVSCAFMFINHNYIKPQFVTICTTYINYSNPRTTCLLALRMKCNLIFRRLYIHSKYTNIRRFAYENCMKTIIYLFKCVPLQRFFTNHIPSFVQPVNVAIDSKSVGATESPNRKLQNFCGLFSTATKTMLYLLYCGMNEKKLYFAPQPTATKIRLKLRLLYRVFSELWIYNCHCFFDNKRETRRLNHHRQTEKQI